MTLWSFIFTWILPVVATIISVGSFIYTMRTYRVTHRPYIGGIEWTPHLIGDPPTRMLWWVTLKNVGSVPAWLKVEENKATLTSEGQTTPLPMATGHGGGGIYLMPGQTSPLHGGFSDTAGRAMVRDVLSGRVVLEVSIRLSYESSGALWWKDKYHYAITNRYRSDITPPHVRYGFGRRELTSHAYSA